MKIDWDDWKSWAGDQVGAECFPQRLAKAMLQTKPCEHDAKLRNGCSRAGKGCAQKLCER